MSKLFYGKYRGVVTNNKDPSTLGRIRAQVPTVLGYQETGWALPCAPYGGKNVGFFFVPPVGANVWIEFEAGNPNNPIWSGCFWRTGETPSDDPEIKVIKTDFAGITVEDLTGAGQISIESKTGLKILMNEDGIEIVNGAASIKLTPTIVSINNETFEVV